MVSNSPPKGKVFNVGPQNPTSIKEVVERCAAALHIPFEDLCETTEDRLGQDSMYWLNSGRIHFNFGWEPLIGWDVGLNEMVQWGEKYLDQIKDLDPTYILRA
jgi:dTDP-glucose 4,6-dehydratase